MPPEEAPLWVSFVTRTLDVGASGVDGCSPGGGAIQTGCGVIPHPGRAGRACRGAGPLDAGEEGGSPGLRPWLLIGQMKIWVLTTY